ncbi:hypothetical protein V493_00609 [Pseudogymnoascus sp. VKM F-4281 (FW-2241)]|nr:hypothetical protein V493_00609 [Pseudogymnoascus sp. VKM F-4281 (FW-2241)]
MQRSTSLPGPAHASPSLPASEPLFNSKSTLNQTSRPPSSNPRHAPERQSPYASFLRPADQGIHDTNAQEDATKTPSAETSKSPSPNLHKPLLEDVSQYTTIDMRDAAIEANSTTLEELAHLVRLSTYQERKRRQTRVRLQRSLVSTALSARLARCGELAHRTLVDSFRSDDKKTFATLNNAIHDVSNSCDATRRFAALEPDPDIGQPGHGRPDEPGTYWTFMHEIPTQTRDTLLNFLTQIRTNPEYLATRICALTPSELTALTVFHQGLEPVDSVLPFHTRPRGQASSLNRTSAHAPSPVERLLSFQRHDPLSALIHTCFANSAGPDSTEHLRRTEIWATVCARLISTENKIAIDPFICSVLNIWTAMREWSGRSNLEWYLMKILEDGAFIVEKSEGQSGIRAHGEPRNVKDSIAAEEFFDSAIKGLFEIVDDPGAEGIPESVLELGNAILRKLDPRKHGATKRFLVSKWLFLDFLLNAIVHPESHGMMTEYHISEYARQRILKEVALRAGRLVVDLTWKQSPATPPDIKVHIENIMGRFRTSKIYRSNPKLLPARSITSLRETAEVRPYLVISPSDLVTMVNALFPERRPTSGSTASESHFGGFPSAASSISGFSVVSRPPSMAPTSRGFDTASIVSESESSIFSDVTSREPLLDDHSIATHRFSSTSISSMSQGPKFDDEGYRLRQAIREMSHTLGQDVISGSCHPCAEQWTVLFMELDGTHLSTQMLHDEDDVEDEEETSSSDSDADTQRSRPDLDKGYHQLRDSILKLVGEYEIPRSIDDTNDSRTFSNRANILEGHRKGNRLYKKKSSRGLEAQSRNPYRAHTLTSPIISDGIKEDQQDDHVHGEANDAKSSVLLDMLEAAEKQCQAQSDFVNAHLYWKTSQQLHTLSSSSLRQNGFVSLLNIFSRGPRDSIRRSAAAIEEYDAWLVWLKQLQERHDSMIEAMMRSYRALRDKMWYVTDVRNSAAYDGTRNVALALRAMARPKNNKRPISATSRARNINRPSTTNNFLVRTETQVLDILAASDEHGGPNKLSDEQSDKTSKWLLQFGIENFCKGEERIHRFCLEIDSCISKLVGDSLMDGPVLWSSELFYRDKRYLDTGRQKGDLVLNGFGGLSISGDGTSEPDSSQRSSRGIDINATARASPRDLRSMSMRNGSQQSFDSSKWGSSRMSVSGDIMDSQDYFGHASPVLAIDSATTFWSPFNQQVRSPTPSVRSFRPGTSSTTNDTVMDAGGEATSAPTKQTFLIELKQTLTALLISDLGSLVFSRGSETDSWFSGDLGQECMDRKARKDRKAKRKSKRGLEKKRSFRDLRAAHSKEAQTSESSEVPEKVSTRDSSRLSHGSSTPSHHSRTNSSATLDASAGASMRQQIRENTSTDFPYKAAFRKLLTMFSVHPNPYSKLNALYELEHLVIASLTTIPRRKALKHGSYMASPRSSTFPADYSREPSFVTPRASNVGEAIDNCKERRSHAIYEAEPAPPARKTESRSITSPAPATTDMIVDVLQDLFREAGMRPKTLFRDLQYIAAFIPASVLDKTDRGKAFWDAGLAALGLKQDVCRTMIDIADEIVQHYTSTRQPVPPPMGPGQSQNSSRGSVDSNSEPEIMQYGMQDAARMWTITAKEGDPAAERELAIFYLTHPELVERTTLPLSRPRETFKAQVMEMHAGGGEGDRERSDPATMCAAYHWMELSSQGGDELAKNRPMDDLNGLEWSASSKSSGGASKVPPRGTGSYFGSISAQQPMPPLGGSSRTSTPISAQRSGAANPSSSKPATDSFANLVSFGPAKTATLTLQQQQDKLLAEKAKKEEEKRKQYDADFGNTNFWDGQAEKAGFGTSPFGSNAPASTSRSPALPTPPGLVSTNPFAVENRENIGKTNGEEEDLFAAFNADTEVDKSSYYPPPSASPETSDPSQDSQLDLSNPNAWKKSAGPDMLEGFQDDDDPFGLGQMPQRGKSPAVTVSRADDDDDFLGDLGKPVEEVRRRERVPTPVQTPSSPDESEGPVSDDPWDKAVNELVDMGFSAESSRRALTESGSGLNLQAAVGWLLNDAHRVAKEKAQGRSGSRPSERSRESSSHGAQAAAETSGNETIPSWMRQERGQSQQRRDDSRSPASDSDVTAKAAAVGSNLFKTANSLWKTSQKRVQKVVAEYQQDVDPSQPKWMRDTSAAEGQRPPEKGPLPIDPRERGRKGEPSSPSVTDEAMMLEIGSNPPPKRNLRTTPSDRAQSSASSSRGPSPALSNATSGRSTPLPRRQQVAPTTAMDAKSRLTKQVLEEQSAQAYVSPARRKKATPTPKAAEEPDLLFGDTNGKQSNISSRPEPARTNVPATKTPQARQPRPSVPIPVRPKAPERTIPSVSPSALAMSHQHRLAGTAHFKRGDYASALDSYTQSLSSLPQGHPITIILLCNRSLTAIKTGDPKTAVSDADTALSLIGPSRGSNEVIDLLDKSATDSKKGMGEFYGKALMRKAEALEQMERWSDAGAVWRQAVEGGAGGAIATQGRLRCEKALAPKAPPQRPRTAPPSRPTVVKDSEAVSRMRAANAAADKADDEKFELSDSVDARIAAWRDGRRDNLRALLGGLDNVLWEGSGWKKVGMHDLIMNGKVKINYMKAIAKVHPDKLSQDANTEVKMISSAVFSTLNEAWDKFKAENGM